MSFEFAAPHPAIQTVSILPNADLSDTEALTASLSAQRATDGTLYTYVKKKGGRRKLQWTFRLRRPKALELRAFFLSYASSKIRATDHNDRVWVGHITNNPLEFESAERAAPAISDLAPELVVVIVEFEGIEQ